MNVLFDNCTPPVYASTLHGFIFHSGHAACHIKDLTDLPNGRHSSDLEWIDYLRQSNERWIFVTGDGRLLRNRAERAALRSARLVGFILAAAYQKTPPNQVLSVLLWKWPEIVAITDLVQPPAMYEIPIGKATKLRQLPL